MTKEQFEQLAIGKTIKEITWRDKDECNDTLADDDLVIEWIKFTDGTQLQFETSGQLGNDLVTVYFWPRESADR